MTRLLKLLVATLVCGPAAIAAAGQAGRVPATGDAPADLRYRTVHTHDGQRTESVTLVKGRRERSEFGDTVLVTQHDTGQLIRISHAAGAYLMSPLTPATGHSPDRAVPSVPSGTTVTLTTTIVDTGEREERFGQTARRIRTTIDRRPEQGACDRAAHRIETDGWYVDLPPALAGLPRPLPQAEGGACEDQVEAVVVGDTGLLGFPLRYTTTIDGPGDRPSVTSMEIVELDMTTLDAALFDEPADLRRVDDAGAFGRVLNDANEAAIATFEAGDPSDLPAKQPGVVRVGIPEFGNRTTSTVDTRALRSRLVAGLGGLQEVRIEAVPMTAAPEPDLLARARRLDYDFVLMGEVTELKVSKPGAFRGLLRAASGDASPPTDITETAIAVRLVATDGRERLSTTTKGKDGSGFSLRTGLGLARFAGTMYLNMFAGPALSGRLNGGLATFGGLGLMGGPSLLQTGMPGGGRGGFDVAAGAAVLLAQQGVMMNDANPVVGDGGGPSFDESIGEALDGAARAVARAVRR